MKLTYFKHDTDAHRDVKIRKLMIAYGLEGYGLYWYCLEQIVSKIKPDDISCQLEYDSEIVAHETGTSRERIEDIMKRIVELGLFEDTSGIITCTKVMRRLEQSQTSNPEMRKLIKTFQDNGKNVMTVSGQHHDSVVITSDQTRLDKIRLDKTRLDKSNTTTTVSSPKAKTHPCPYQKIIDLYHEKLPELPQVKIVTDKRKRAMKARWINGYDLNDFDKYFTFVKTSPFLMGNTQPSPGRKQFIASFDFLIREDAIVNTMEGKYHG